MWRNTDMIDFVEWLRAHNAGLAADDAAKVGFYGIDIYSLRGFAKVMLQYLGPWILRPAAERYACFDHYGPETQVYGIMTGLGLAKSCEDEAIHQLVDLQRRVAAGEDHAGALPRPTPRWTSPPRTVARNRTKPPPA